MQQRDLVGIALLAAGEDKVVRERRRLGLEKSVDFVEDGPVVLDPPFCDPRQQTLQQQGDTYALGCHGKTTPA